MERKFRLLIVVLGLILVLIKTETNSEELLREADFYQQLDDNRVWCQLCPRRCIIPEGKKGFCQVRENRKGKLYSLVHSKPCSADLSPIEKAPFYHFIPGHTRLAVATVGCNLKCKYCQNWHISQVGPGEVKELNLSPKELVEQAKKEKVNSICFTYTEPIVFYEYVYDVAKLAKENGIMISIVSNGYINPQPLKKLLSVLDAVKIDLKGFSEEFYQEVTFGELEPLLTTLKTLKQEGAYFEIVVLIVPTLNDDLDQIKKMCNWIKENLGDEVPLHFSRFFPAYKLIHLFATPIQTLEQAAQIAQQAGLKYVYIGNVPGHPLESTFCPVCKKRLIHRIQYTVLENNIKEGKCKFCGLRIPGIWQ